MLQLYIKKILSKNLVLPFLKGKRFIFIYHDISDTSAPHHSSHYSTTPDSFSKHLLFFKQYFKMLSLDDIVSDRLDDRDNYAAVVFDDGFKSVLDIAAPMLWDQQIPFGVFINKYAVTRDRLWLSDIELNNPNLISNLTNRFGMDNLSVDKLKENAEFNGCIEGLMDDVNGAHQQRVYLNEEEVKMLHKMGVIIGSHTVNHPVLSITNREVQQYEIQENKSYIDNLLSQNTLHFAFPFGKKEHFNGQSLSILETIGHHFWYTSNPIGFQAQDVAKKLIPRIGLLNDSTAQIMFYINRQFLRRIEL